MKMADLKIGDIAIISNDPTNSQEHRGMVIAIGQTDNKGLRAQVMGPMARIDYSWTPLSSGIDVIKITDSIMEGVKNATK